MPTYWLTGLKLKLKILQNLPAEVFSSAVVFAKAQAKAGVIKIYGGLIVLGLGLALLACDGLVAGSFYVPLKKIKNWAWESGWLINAIVGYMIVPWLYAYIIIPNLNGVFGQAPSKIMLLCFAFGALWGIGGLTFGLAVRFLGVSLGYAIAFGFCAAFGTLIPPMCFGTFGELLTKLSGQVTLAGVFVCVLGIGVCAWAGTSKDKELSAEAKKKNAAEFNFTKGLMAAFSAGLMIACMALSIAFGKPIANIALQNGASPIWQHCPTIAITCAGGFITNLLWCAFLNVKNSTWKNYTNISNPAVFLNYLFAAIAGLMWYVQMMLYGMGVAYMGKYAYAGWTVRMAFIVIFSNMWGLIYREWAGCSRKTHLIIAGGLAIVMLSVFFIGTGGYIASGGK